jgi:CBS domain-containing protein
VARVTAQPHYNRPTRAARDQPAHRAGGAETVLATEIMVRDVVTVAPGTSLRTAAELMLRHGINGLPVVDPQGGVIGMVGIRDVLRVPSPSRSEMPILKWARLEDKAVELGLAADKVVDLATSAVLVAR